MLRIDNCSTYDVLLPIIYQQIQLKNRAIEGSPQAQYARSSWWHFHRSQLARGTGPQDPLCNTLKQRWQFYLRLKSGNDDIHWWTLGGNHLFWSSRVFPHLWGLRTGCWTAPCADPSIWYVQTNRNRETLLNKLSRNLLSAFQDVKMETFGMWWTACLIRIASNNSRLKACDHSSPPWISSEVKSGFLFIRKVKWCNLPDTHHGHQASWRQAEKE